MPKDNLSEIFDHAESLISKNNLTIRELSENANVPEDLISIFLDRQNNVVDDLSRLLEFLKIKMKFRQLKFSAYIIVGSGTKIKVTRVIKPYCSIVWDKTTKKFYRFTVRHHSIKLSEKQKEIILLEMKSVLEEHLENS